MFDESDKYQTAATSNRQPMGRPARPTRSSDLRWMFSTMKRYEEFSKNNMGFVMVRKSEVSPKKNVVWRMFNHEKNVI